MAKSRLSGLVERREESRLAGLVKREAPPEEPVGPLVPYKIPPEEIIPPLYPILRGIEDWESLIPLQDRIEMRKMLGDEYDETGKRMVGSQYFGGMLDIPPEKVFQRYGIYADWWLDEEDVPPDKAWDRIKQRFTNGQVQVQLMDLGYEILNKSWSNPEAYEESLANIQKLQTQLKGDYRQEFRGFFEKMFGATAEQLPIMWQALKESPVGGTAGGLIGGLLALGAGALAPFPEEVVSVPAAATKGIMVGAGLKAADRIRQLEAGGMFLELMEVKDKYGNTIDPKTAFVVSHAVGAINGAIEIVEWKILLGTFGIGDSLFKKSVEKVTTRLLGQGTLKQVLAKYVAKYGIALGAEVLQEVEQETTNIVFGELAKELNNARRGTDFKPISAEDLKSRYAEVTAESLRAFGIIVAPGTIISGAVEAIGKKPAEVVEKLPEKPPEVIERPPEAPEAAVVAKPAPEVEILPKKPPAPEVIAPKVLIPESEKEWVARAKSIQKELRQEIEKTDIYQTALEAQAVQREEVAVGVVYVGKQFKGEVETAIENHPLLRFHITHDPTKGVAWDTRVQEGLLLRTGDTAGEMDISVFLERVAESIKARKKVKGLNVAALEALADSKQPYYEMLTAKYDMIKQGFTAAEINENIREIAMDYPDISQEAIESQLIPVVEGKPSVEAKQRMAEEVEAKARPLRQKIHAIAAQKGLTKKALSDLKLKHTGYRHLTGKIAKTKITPEQLTKLLQAVQKVRPKRIGYKPVITKKTERKIQSLKESLTKKTQMTEADFAEILGKEIRGREPKYIDAKHFITETQGKDIIKRMLDEAEIIKVTEGFEEAIRGNDEIRNQVKILDGKIEQKSKRDPWSLESMRYYNQQAQVKTGAPFYPMYMDFMNTHLDTTKTRRAIWTKLENTIGKKQFRAISRDDRALKRVSDYIASQSALKKRPLPPKDITDAEVKLAKEIQAILKDKELEVRVAKFFNFYYYNQPIAQFDRYKREIHKAVDILEGQGREALIDYLKTQVWGVIKSGYEPLEVLKPKLRPYTTGPTTVGKGHIKIRTDIEYHTQERNILQRLSSYMRQIDMLYNMSPKINAYVRLYDDNMAKFKNPATVKENIEIFLRNLKRYNIQGGFFEKHLSRLYAQAMRVIIMPSPVLSFRNLFQNAAFEHDKSILIDRRNKTLSNQRVEYLETYVLQTRAMIEEYFMVAERPYLGLRFLTKLIDKIRLYPHSDVANRHWSFWAKINQVDRALQAETTAEMMTEAKFNDITELEQRYALGILAKDGKEAMARYVARVHVDDIHFLYERSQRSPAEMTPLGKVVGNLFLFPRAYGEKLAHAANKMLRGKTRAEQWRGLKILLAVVGGGMLTGALYRRVTGRKRNPYDPLEILSYEVGGLAWGAVESANKIYANMLLAISGDEFALAALTSAIPGAADMFIPFYDYTLRGYEALTDQKNVDRKVVRQIRMMIDKEYRIRGGAYKVRRTALEKWQYFIAGAGVDQKEKKRKKPISTIRKR